MLNAGSSHQNTATSDELTRMAVTLLLDTLGSEDQSGLSQVDACAVYTLACLGVTYGMQDCRYISARACRLLSKCLGAQHMTFAHAIYICMVCVSIVMAHLQC